MDRQRMEYCLAQVGAYRASGQKSEAWALANGIKPRELASWCSHAQRWRAILDGVPVAPAVRKAGAGFVAARLPVPSVGVRFESSCMERRLASNCTGRCRTLPSWRCCCAR